MSLLVHQVFMKAYIPRTLTEVSHYERDVDLMKTKEEESAISGHQDNVRNTKGRSETESFCYEYIKYI